LLLSLYIFGIAKLDKDGQREAPSIFTTINPFTILGLPHFLDRLYQSKSRSSTEVCACGGGTNSI